MTYRWLVSSGGRRGALVRILQGVPRDSGGWVIVTDASRFSAAGQLADDFQTVPRVADEQFIPAMVDICRERQIRTVVPTIDTELSAYAKHADEFAATGTDVLISTPEVIQLAMDKWHLYRWLEQSGFPTVESWEKAAFDAALADGPIVAKPRGGSSSIGVMVANSAAELPLASLTDDYIIQRRASGFEITVDFAVGRDGSFLGAVPRRRLEVRAGEVSKAVTVRATKLEELVRDVAAALPGAYGVLNLQVFLDPISGSLAIIELNARVGGGYPLSFQAGADFFSILGRSSGRDKLQWKPGLIMLRYDDAVFFNSDEYGTGQL